MTLLLGIPSKGRLSEACQSFFADAGMPLVSSGARDYSARLRGVDGVEVAYLSAGEIAQSLIGGALHLGVTGEDLLHETAGERLPPVHWIKALGFGRADVVVAVPASWIDVETMADLDDVCLEFHARHHRRMRVATKFVHLTRGFFARSGVRDYRIVESLGATEGAPAAGSAELIVDITSTGATLAANQLKILQDGVILRSQAHLAASLAAAWSGTARAAAARLLARIAARADARATLIVRVRMDEGVDAALDALEARQGCRVATRPTPPAPHAEAVILTPRDNLQTVVETLRAAGAAAPVTAQTAEYVFAPDNVLFEALERALPPKPL